MLYVCNFADKNYRSQQALSTKSTDEKGNMDKVIELNEKDIQELKDTPPTTLGVDLGFGNMLKY